MKVESGTMLRPTQSASSLPATALMGGLVQTSDTDPANDLPLGVCLPWVSLDVHKSMFVCHESVTQGLHFLHLEGSMESCSRKHVTQGTSAALSSGKDESTSQASEYSVWLHGHFCHCQLISPCDVTAPRRIQLVLSWQCNLTLHVVTVVCTSKLSRNRTCHSHVQPGTIRITAL